MKRLFVDLDGVLADFDGAYQRQFGVRLDRHRKAPADLWENIRAHGRWFESLPLMPGALDLWAGVSHYSPILLSGLNQLKLPSGAAQKRRWVDRHFGAGVPLITCRSREKCLHGQPGDILIDDWRKYRHLWEEMGGTFILHTSVESSLATLEAAMRATPRGPVTLGDSPVLAASREARRKEGRTITGPSV